MKNKLTIPVVDDMIVERINEEQAAGRNDDGRNGLIMAYIKNKYVLRTAARNKNV